jgi:hypothetical protein
MCVWERIRKKQLEWKRKRRGNESGGGGEDEYVLLLWFVFKIHDKRLNKM